MYISEKGRGVSTPLASLVAIRNLTEGMISDEIAEDVLMVGFEPTRAKAHYALNVARLPVPPHQH